MAVVSVAIVLSFHLKSKATDVELRMAKPLGAIFWALSLACLLVGCANYIREFLSRLPLQRDGRRSKGRGTLMRSRHGEQVQPEGCDRAVWVEDTVGKLPMVKGVVPVDLFNLADTNGGFQVIGAIALSIVGACFTLLVINGLGSADS